MRSDMVGSESGSRLTERVLGRIEARAAMLNTEAMQKILGEIDPNAKVSPGDFGCMWLLSYQAALMEEQVADNKTIRDAQEEV